jgi:single-strand DNA-binding protein
LFIKNCRLNKGDKLYNKVILLGNLTKQIEFSVLNGETNIAKTSIAVSRKFGQKEEVCFVDLVIWGRTAEIARDYLKKGSKVLIEGRLVFDQWKDKDGNNRSRHSVQVENLTMVGNKEQTETKEPIEAKEPIRAEVVEIRTEKSLAEVDGVPF